MPRIMGFPAQLQVANGLYYTHKAENKALTEVGLEVKNLQLEF